MRRIALMTDFGTRDPYVAQMKGVLATRTDAPVIDLTHEIAPFDVLEGAWFLATAARWWPEGTIFVCVVDPGVGSARRIVTLEQEGRVFLAPDNGLLTFVSRNPSSAFGTFSPHEERRQLLSLGQPSPLRRGEKVPKADEGSFFSVENEALFLPNGSTTFHGRDRFAPVAAALANGLAISELGPRIDDLVALDYEPPHYGDDGVRGTVVAIDRFGNVITDLEVARVPFAPFALSVGDYEIVRVKTNYADAGPGPFLIAGSSGHIEISIANASAAEELWITRLQRVGLRPL